MYDKRFHKKIKRNLDELQNVSLETIDLQCKIKDGVLYMAANSVAVLKVD